MEDYECKVRLSVRILFCVFYTGSGGWFSKGKPAIDVTSPSSANEGGRSRGYYIGVQMMTLTADIVHQLNLQLGEGLSSTGVLVVSVMYDSPAYG